MSESNRSELHIAINLGTLTGGGRFFFNAFVNKSVKSKLTLEELPNSGSRDTENWKDCFRQI